MARTRPTAPSVRAVAEAVIAARRTNWRHPGTERKWRRLFDALVFPRIGDMPVSRVTLDDVRDIIVPHWKGRGSTGYVLRQHLDYVLRWAIAHGYRADNPVEKLKVLLPRVNAVVEHHPSLPHTRVATAMAAVQATSVEEAVKLLLVFVVLCASRLGEAIGARWSEIDVVDRLWTLPAERTKAQRSHRVPLSIQALEVVERARALNRPGPLVFTALNGRGEARPVAPGAVARLLQALALRDERGRRVVAHGFRTTFRVWAMEQAQASFEVCEAALAHVHADRTVSAYARSDVLEARRPLMQSWADYALPAGATRNRR
ncbi:MAG: site-specific integrase [Acidobacteria bacterium]|nr:site-specific integrase [Acidobacteriota bacterium]